MLTRTAPRQQTRPHRRDVTARAALPAVTRERFDAVLFDLDGVLTATAALHAQCWKRMFDEYLGQLRDESRAAPASDGRPARFRAFDIVADYKHYVDGKPRYDGVHSFLESRGVRLPCGDPSDPPGDRTICGLGNHKDAMVKRAIEQGRVETFADAVRWARRLREQGFKLGVVSSSRNCGAVLRAAKIDHLFDLRVDGQTLADLNLPGKPAPDSFLKAAAALGADPARTAVVEDAIAGVQAARAGGFGLVIGVDREGGGHAASLVGNGANVVVRDLGELVNTEMQAAA